MQEGTLLVNLLGSLLDSVHDAELHDLVQGLDQLNEVLIRAALHSPVEEKDGAISQRTPIPLHHSSMVKAAGCLALIKHCKETSKAHSHSIALQFGANTWTSGMEGEMKHLDL